MKRKSLIIANFSSFFKCKYAYFFSKNQSIKKTQD